MRRAFFALLLAGSLVALPALAAEPRPPIYKDIGRNFTTGAAFYFQTVGSWMEGLLARFGLNLHRAAPVEEGATCGVSVPCSPGLVCLNACDGTGCERYGKRCVKGNGRVVVLGEFSACGDKNLCADGTDCTRVCPSGLDCGGSGEDYRCMKPVEPSGSCSADVECVSVCGQLPFPPIGPSAYRASCTRGACLCQPVLSRPDAPRVACPDDLPKIMSCPIGTWNACTPRVDCPAGQDCPPILTCLTAPVYGGTCLVDAGCAGALCAEGAEPFCGDDHRCKCRAKVTETLSCATTADCGSSLCASDEIAACVNGACACAPAAAVSACKTAADCASCPDGYDSACENAACACKKTTVVPFACKTVDDCSSVNCPDGYDKGCRNDVCVCARQVPQP